MNVQDSSIVVGHEVETENIVVVPYARGSKIIQSVEDCMTLVLAEILTADQGMLALVPDMDDEKDPWIIVSSKKECAKECDQSNLQRNVIKPLMMLYEFQSKIYV